MNTPLPMRDAFGTPKSLMSVPQRTYETVGLRPDGSRDIVETRAPALPLFDSAFSAFGRGVLMPRKDGPVPIEDLVPGDLLRTADGMTLPVLWIGSTTFVPADMGARATLYRITADSFGFGRPESYVTLGDGARLMQTPAELKAATAGQNLLTPIDRFVDNVNVIKMRPPTPVRLFHIMLEQHAVLDVCGVAFETFHPGPDAMRSVSHAQRDLFLSMFPHIQHHAEFGPLTHQRAPEVRRDLNAA